MDENTRIKAWRNSKKKNSYEFFNDISEDDWLGKMTKKEFLEYMYSGKTNKQVERWIENFKQGSTRY